MFGKSCCQCKSAACSMERAAPGPKALSYNVFSWDERVAGWTNLGPCVYASLSKRKHGMGKNKIFCVTRSRFQQHLLAKF